MEERLETLVNDTVRESMDASRRTLLTEMEAMFEKISEQNNNSQLAKISSLVSIEQPRFKRKSNEDQFKANSKVLSKLSEVDSCLQQRNLPEAKTNLTEAVDMVTYRQKLIQMADRSDLGWRTVTEYEANPLADDSEDERKMDKAEARANRKMKAETSKKTKTGRKQPYRRAPAGSAPSGQTGATLQSKPGNCFHCGKTGHWRRECPQNASFNKMSIIDCSILKSEGCCWDLNTFSYSKSETNLDKNVIEMSSVFPSIYETIRSGIEVNKGFTSDICECEGSALEMENTIIDSNTTVSPFGRLKSYAKKWRSVSGESYIVDVVENGYKLPFKTIPPSAFLKNNKSARDNPSFVYKEIKSLLEKGVISITDTIPIVVNPLTVAYNKVGKPRLVLDCRHINEFIHVFKTKYEDIRVAQSLFKGDVYAFTYDLKGAYHHIDISKSHRGYLGFSWNYQGKTTYYVFNSLPFGLSCSGHIFTKTVGVVVAYLRSLGHKVVMFLDDGIGGDTDYEQALISSKFVKNSILEFGFLIAEEKCKWLPSKIVTWLGHVLDFYQNKLFITEDRIASIENGIDSVIKQINRDKYRLLKVRILAALVGRIISLQFVIGNTVRLRTREMYNCIISRASWNAPVLVTETAVQEINFWKENVRKLNVLGRLLYQEQYCDISIYCDASSVGYGGFLDVYNGNSHTFGKIRNVHVTSDMSPEVDLIGMNVHLSPEVDKSPPEVGLVPNDSAQGIDPAEEGSGFVSESYDFDTFDSHGYEMTFSNTNVENLLVNSHCNEVVGSWLSSEQSKSSSWREAEAVYRVLRSNVTILKNKTVKVHCDNMNVKSILSHGSRKGDLQSIALCVNTLCEEHNIRLCIEWIPRHMNQLSDYLSRCHDCDDWSISDNCFDHLDRIWGRHTVDRFSSHFNNHCARFNSRWWVPGTEDVNAFEQSWKEENNWLVPPPRMIIECLNKIESDEASCTLIVPKWKYAAFWPRLIGNSGKFIACIRALEILPKEDLIRVAIDLKPTIRSQMELAGVDVQKHNQTIEYMAGYITKSRADSTNVKYTNCFKHFDEYCTGNSFISKPATAVVVAMYITHMMRVGKSHSVVSAAVYSIKWVHSLHGFEDPTRNTMVTHLVEASKRMRSTPIQRKDVIDSTMLQNLCKMYVGTKDVINLRDLAIIALGFAGFLRFNEISSLYCSDVTFNTDHLILRIRQSKTDVYREGKQIPIAKGITEACPYELLKGYISAAGLCVKSNTYLFRPCFRSKGVSGLIKSNKKLSYSRVRECIQSKLKMVAPNLNLSTHSLRASGATAAANAVGVSDRCLKRHGRWKSDLAKDGYIVDSLENKLLITKQLKL